jgi:DNA-binding Lrp family transcriptional regulator
MLESATLDDQDLLLVTALQTAPRADWQRIGQVLGVAASTAARRWERLTDAGLAWLSCHPLRLPGMTAFMTVIEVDCAAGRVHEVAAQLAEDTNVFNIGVVTGRCDLLFTAAFGDPAALARYTGFRVGRIDGVLATRSHVATAIHTEGSRWRLDRLDAEHSTALEQPARTAPPSRTDPDAADAAIMTALSIDCRLSAAELAERTGMSPTSVRRRLARIDADKMLVYRCEVARFLSGWPVALTLWATAPPDRIAAVTAQLIGMRETRVCASIAGPHNLMFTVWLRGIDDLSAFEARLAKRVPDLAIGDRSVTLWSLKLGGHILDPQGRHIRAVPIALDPHAFMDIETNVVKALRDRP